MLRKPARTAAHASASFGGSDGSVRGRRRSFGWLVGRPVERHVHLHELPVLKGTTNNSLLIQVRCDVAISLFPSVCLCCVVWCVCVCVRACVVWTTNNSLLIQVCDIAISVCPSVCLCFVACVCACVHVCVCARACVRIF